MKRVAVALALVLGIVGAGLLTGCGGPPNSLVLSSVRGNKGGPRTFVTVVKEDDGTCQASDGVGVLGGKKNNKITWYVSNYCDVTQYLVFTHYQERLDATTLGPVETNVVDPDPKNYDRLDPGQEDRKVDAKIIKDNSSTKDKSYKYWICVSPSPIPNPLPDPLPASIKCLDPDVDVWP
jgi:hypothetical protein